MTDVVAAGAAVQVPVEVRWWKSSRRVIGILLVALWVVLAAWSVWAAPRQSSADQLREDVTAGSVSGWLFTDQQPSWGDSGSGVLGGWPRTQIEAVDANSAGILVWADSRHRQYWIRISQLGQMPAEAGSQVFGDATQAWLTREFRAHHDSSTTPGDLNLPMPILLATWAFALVGLAGVLGGDQPRIANRWYWFWVCGLTAGVGLLAYAVFECLRDPKPRAARFGGGMGFVTAVVGSAAMSLLFSLVSTYG